MQNTRNTTIIEIKKRGYVRCGVSLGIFGLSYKDIESEQWRGFDVDVAKAVAEAVLGRAEAVEFIPVEPGQRFEALDRGLIDLGTFNASATLAREARYGVTFLPTLLYDGEAFLVRREEIPEGTSPAAASVLSLTTRRIAAQAGATTAENLYRFFTAHGADYEICEYSDPGTALEAYSSGKCNVYALDRIPLSGERLRLDDRDQHVILGDIVSKEAMGPVVRHGDPYWAKSVTWIVRSLIEAEELNLTSDNVYSVEPAAVGYVYRFLNPSPEICANLQLGDHFTREVIAKIGNYGEIFERNLGRQSPLALPRGQNSLWNRGGLLFTPPVQ